MLMLNIVFLLSFGFLCNLTLTQGFPESYRSISLPLENDQTVQENENPVANTELGNYIISQLNSGELDEIASNLATLSEGVASFTDEVNFLKTIQQYENLKRILRNIKPIEDMVSNLEDDIANSKVESKRMMEKIDKEDDWLSLNGYLVDPGKQILSSRRRFTTGELDIHDLDEMEQPGDMSISSHDSTGISKKDIESLVYQANPALTVHELPEEPEISFRKANPDFAKPKSQNSGFHQAADTDGIKEENLGEMDAPYLRNQGKIDEQELMQLKERKKIEKSDAPKI